MSQPVDTLPPDVASLTITRSNWMGQLWRHFGKTTQDNPFGDIPLCQMPIPGSHDSGTVGMDSGSATQTKTIAEQLALGIRYFDIRPMVKDGVYYIHHGPTRSSNDIGQCQYGSDGKPVVTENKDHILYQMRAFLRANPGEIVILKTESFQGTVGQEFTPDDHINFRFLLDHYLSLIPQRPVAELTLNALYAEGPDPKNPEPVRRAIVFYGDPLQDTDVTYDKVWTYRPGADQRDSKVPRECFDPWWEHDIGSFGGDDGDQDFEKRWIPYHVQNLKDWEADGLGRFLVTQAQMQILHGLQTDAAVESAKKNNPRNIALFAGWMRAGVPGAAGPADAVRRLRPNVLTLDFVEYGSLCDEIIAHFLSLTPQNLKTAYGWHDFGLTMVRPALKRAKDTDRKTVLDPAKPGAGYRLVTDHPPGWACGDALFLAYRHPAPGTTPVYAETQIAHPGQRFYYSTRGEQAAKDNGWTLGEVVFHAFDTQAPGTIPIYVDTPTDHMHQVYAYNTGPVKAGWTRRGVVFYAYPAVFDRVPVYVYEYKTPGHYRFSLNAHLDYKDGWTLRGAEFRALTTDSTLGGTVFEMFPKQTPDADKPRYTYSSENADVADKQGWKQLGAAFRAYANTAADPGLVAVHEETRPEGLFVLHYFSPRDVSEVPAGWTRARDTPFYAYPYRKG